MSDPRLDPSGEAAPERVVIDGIPVDPLTEADVVAHVSASIRTGVGGIILTANSDILRQLRNPSHRVVADRADLVVADGMPLVWASRLQGRPVPERVAGADLVWSLSGGAADHGYPIYLLGAGPGVAEAAAQALTARFPQLDVCGWSSPPLGFVDDPDAWDAVELAVRSARPALVFVALGFPKQDEVAFRLAGSLPGAWFLGCGGALDMASGRTTRAPGWARAVGAEWLHRLWLEPRRLATRYLVHDAPYTVGLLVRAALGRLRAHAILRRANPKSSAN